MAMIEISNLNLAGNDLLADSESFLTELTATDSNQIFGGKNKGCGSRSGKGKSGKGKSGKGKSGKGGYGGNSGGYGGNSGGYGGGNSGRGGYGYGCGC
jgi:hypothetical protein